MGSEMCIRDSHGSYDDDLDRRDHHDDGADGTDHDSHLGLLRDCKEHSHRRRCVRTSQTDDGYHDNDLDVHCGHDDYPRDRVVGAVGGDPVEAQSWLPSALPRAFRDSGSLHRLLVASGDQIHPDHHPFGEQKRLLVVRFWSDWC